MTSPIEAAAEEYADQFDDKAWDTASVWGTAYEAFKKGDSHGFKRAEAEMLQLWETAVILRDDADFFTSDVRKLTAWERFLSALKTYAAFKAKGGGNG